MLENLLYVLIILLGFPTGLFLASLCKDEIRSWKKRLNLISLISLIFIIILLFLNLQFKKPIIITLLFIITSNLAIILAKTNN